MNELLAFGSEFLARLLVILCIGWGIGKLAIYFLVRSSEDSLVRKLRSTRLFEFTTWVEAKTASVASYLLVLVLGAFFLLDMGFHQLQPIFTLVELIWLLYAACYAYNSALYRYRKQGFFSWF